MEGFDPAVKKVTILVRDVGNGGGEQVSIGGYTCNLGDYQKFSRIGDLSCVQVRPNMSSSE